MDVGEGHSCCWPCSLALAGTPPWRDSPGALESAGTFLARTGAGSRWEAGWKPLCSVWLPSLRWASARRFPWRQSLQRTSSSCSCSHSLLVQACVAPLAVQVFSRQCGSIGDFCFQWQTRARSGDELGALGPVGLTHGAALAGLQAQPGVSQSPAAARTAAAAVAGGCGSHDYCRGEGHHRVW